MQLDVSGNGAAVEDQARRLRFVRLDAAAVARLRGLRAVVRAALPEVADRFYRFFGQDPGLAALLGSAERVARLRVTQAAHWQGLFDGGFDAAYFERAARIAAAHAAIGLAPRWYTAGYCLTLEALVEVLTRRHRARPALAEDIAVVLRAAFLDMDIALSTYVRTDDVVRVQGEMNGLADVLERELQLAVGEISSQTDRLADGSDGLARIAAEMRGMTAQVHDAIGTTANTVNSVASASQQLEAASHEITGQVERAAAVSAQTVAAAESAGRIMATLTDAVEQINGVARLVQSIAQQTKLLALNATIEAARAGAAGRGFAVVASEVKDLARQTEEAIGTVNGQARAIRRAAGEAAQSVAGIGAQIRGVAEIAGGVAESAGQQREATAEIARSVALAASHTGTVADRTQSLADHAAATEETATLFHALAGRVSTGVNALAERLTVILRSNTGASRRCDAREPLCLEFRLQAGSFSAAGWTADLSPHGTLLVQDGPDSLAGTEGTLELDGIGRLQVRIVATSPIGMHVSFREPPPELVAAIAARITREQQAGQKYIAIAQQAAAAVQAAFEGALASGRITRDALFDTMYRAIPGTDPPQVLTQATAICDALMPAIIEPARQSDPAIVFCAACDRDGYIATHNRIYSEPQRPGERDWNAAHSRNRRIFDDRTGLLAARNTKPILVQAYARDMGGGQRVILKEFDAPIVIAGTRWGALRLAVKLS